MLVLLIHTEYESDEVFEDNLAVASDTMQPTVTKRTAIPPPAKKTELGDPDDSVTEPEPEEDDWLEEDTPTATSVAANGTSDTLCWWLRCNPACDSADCGQVGTISCEEGSSGGKLRVRHRAGV